MTREWRFARAFFLAHTAFVALFCGALGMEVLGVGDAGSLWFVSFLLYFAVTVVDRPFAWVYSAVMDMEPFSWWLFSLSMVFLGGGMWGGIGWLVGRSGKKRPPPPRPGDSLKSAHPPTLEPRPVCSMPSSPKTRETHSEGCMRHGPRTPS